MWKKYKNIPKYTRTYIFMFKYSIIHSSLPRSFTNYASGFYLKRVITLSGYSLMFFWWAMVVEYESPDQIIQSNTNLRDCSSSGLIAPTQGRQNIFWHCFWQMKIKQTIRISLQLTICKIKEYNNFKLLWECWLAFVLNAAKRSCC